MTCLNYAESAEVATGLYTSNTKIIRASRYDIITFSCGNMLAIGAMLINSHAVLL